ncbi:serine/threonine protein kinase [Paenibacillus donghaensis]|uniref:Serine/threonine protein kinase n=1 Tax=Paenibacillus donghaensis TaxID=414771 RepID=A0A2Z2KHX2_9BACL|nr:serine/threonine protein kinase [Paenibacillus donghaensis]ASA20472.1 serine/threonine protein kinase [Paenibacillus donghaensis]
MEPQREDRLNQLLELVNSDLLTGVSIRSMDPHEPVEILRLPQPWNKLGTGNYAAVLGHPEYMEYAVKVYAPGRPGIEEEGEVYRRLGQHPSFSECYAAGAGYLLLKRLQGTTFYDCIQRGIPIPVQAIADIDQALAYARTCGLSPHDVHAKNVMLQNGHGLIVDVSDFLKTEDCGMWEDFKQAYERLYRPIASRWVFPVPRFVLEGVRRGYRLWRRRKS